MTADKYIMAQLMTPHHSLKNGSNVSCPLRYFIMSELTYFIQKNITILIFCFQGSFRSQFTDLPKYTHSMIYFGRPANLVLVRLPNPSCLLRTLTPARGISLHFPFCQAIYFALLPDTFLSRFLPDCQ